MRCNINILRCCISGMLMMIASTVFSQVTIVLKNADTFPDSVKNNLYVAGNFNGWDPRVEAFHLIKTNRGYAITFMPDTATRQLEFKFTHGSWSNGEVATDGGYKPNRTYLYVPGMVLDETVEAFDDMTPDKIKIPNSKVIQFTVYAPQLHTNKNIRVYLPCDYANSNKKYPVLYMLDGQNLFDDMASFAGEWGVDECVDSLCANGITVPIIVGIDHAGPQRLMEYSPWVMVDDLGGGDGDAFSDFVALTLKPVIDSMYRTLRDRNNNGVAGSSLGGLMSLYMVTDHPEVFSKAGIFSPAFQTSMMNFENAGKYIPAAPVKFYFICGGREDSGEMVQNTQNMFDLLLNKNFPYISLHLSIESYGTHTESFWRKEFYNALMWLYRE